MTFKNKTTKATTTKKYRCTVLAEKTEEETPVVDETIQIASIKQNTDTEFTVTMSTALESVATSNFSMVRDNDNQVIAVKSATLDSSDSTKVTLVVYTSLTDAKTYTVTYTADDEAGTQSSAQITVTDGTVADVAVTPLTVTAGAETEIKFQTLDAYGVILSDDDYSDTGSYTEITFTSTLGTFDESSSEILLASVGDTADFTMTYHTYQYDTSTGEELNVISKDFTVTAVEDSTTITSYTYTIATSTPDFSTINQTVAAGDTDYNAYFLIKDSNGSDVTASCGYTVESSDNSIVVADGNVAEYVKLKPVAVGSAYLMIKNDFGNVVYTLPITVVAARKLTTLKLSSTSVKISSESSAVAPETCVTTDVTALDQYGESISVNVTAEKKSSDNVAKIESNNGYLTIYGNGETGTGYYNITATDNNNNTKTVVLTVAAVEPTGTITYDIVFLDSNKRIVDSTDTTITSSIVNDIDVLNLNAVLVEKKNGVVTGSVSEDEDASDGDTVKSFVMNLTKGGTNYNSYVDGCDSDGTVSENNTKINAVEDKDGVVTKNLGVGTYKVTYTITLGDENTKTTSTTFTVTDSQATATATVNATKYNESGKTINDALEANVTYYYSGTKLEDVNVIESYGEVGSTNAYVTSVKIEYTVPVNENFKLVDEVTIGKTFTNSYGWTEVTDTENDEKTNESDDSKDNGAGVDVNTET